MLTITDNEIRSLGISPETCMEWIRTSFSLKNRSILPPKISIHLHESDFFNTMPCLLPGEFDMFSVKVVSRIKSQKPALKSMMQLYRASTGELLAMMEADWITAMRTGAVAALATETLECPGAGVYSFMGLGSTAYATMECLAGHLAGKPCEIRLLRYKDQAERFAERFSGRGFDFRIVGSAEELIRDADVVISCITRTDELICHDERIFRPGVLVVPVHTRGFQNCDTVFDKVFADDTGHVSGFANFGKFRKFGELGDVLDGLVPGREDGRERILSYNIGLGLHDACFAYRILGLMGERKSCPANI